MGGRKAIEEVDNKYGMLTVICREGLKGKQAMWKCACDCGNTAVVSGHALRKGFTTSCGCSQYNTITKHGMYKSTTYSSYRHMLDRCYNKNFKQYHDYGGKGVFVCDRWLKPNGKGFQNFLEDMGERPEGKTLNRIQRSSVYSKDTCEWASRSEQNFDKISGRKNTSGRVGVWWYEKVQRWVAEISINRKVKTKRFKSFESASECRAKWEMMYFGFTKEGDKR